MKTKLLILVGMVCLALSLSAQATLSGKITDQSDGEPLIFASVALYQSGVFKAGAETDFDGFYRISNLDPGTYDVEVAYVGYTKKRVEGVVVKAGVDTKLDVLMDTDVVSLDEVVVTSYKVPLVTQDNTTSGSTITLGNNRNYTRSPRPPRTKRKKKGKKKIENLPTRDVSGLNANAAGVASAEQPQIIGARTNATDYYIDGIRVQGDSRYKRLQKRRDKKNSKSLMANQNKASGSNIQPVSKDQSNSSLTQGSLLPEQAPTTAGEGYAEIVENEFIASDSEAFSTFSIDVDKAAYSNVRRFINSGQLPPADAVRTEELINYFDYAYPLPEAGNAFAVHSELGPCPWQEDHHLLQIGIKGYEASAAEAPPANLVFLIDVSGSMSSQNKLPLVQKSLGLLTQELRPIDRVSIVTYAGSYNVALLPTSGDQKKQIMDVVNALGSGGGTAGGAALQRAYELASQYFQPDGSNRVIIATDGDFNVGISSPEALEAFIAEKRATGIYLSVLGFGTGNYKDDRLEILANKGNGNYAYIDGIEEAEKVLVTELAGTLFAIAKDVKLQVEFDTAVVETYRLIGYENRILAKEDFEDDTKDAGELGAGHTVTALYEVVFKAGTEGRAPGVLHLRYKEPSEDQSRYLRHELSEDALALDATSEHFRFAAAVATYAQCLRNSKHKGTATLELARVLADNARQDDLESCRADFVALIRKTEQISGQLAKVQVK